MADRVHLLRRGRIELSCTAAEAGRRIAEIAQSYLGQVPTEAPAT